MKKRNIIIIIAIIIIGVGTIVYSKYNKNIDTPNPVDDKELQEAKRLRALFPDTIGDYTLYNRNADKVDIRSGCNMIEDHPDSKNLGISGEMCTKNATGEYRKSADNKGIFIHLSTITKGKEIYLSLVEKMSKPDKLGEHNVFRMEKPEIGWIPASQFDLIVTQEGVYKIHENGVEQYMYPDEATGQNPVTQYFITQYAPAKK